MVSPATRLVIFDVDGTMVDSQHVIVACMTHAFELHGLTPPTPLAIRRIVGLSLVEAVQALIPDATRVHAATVAESYKDAFREKRVSGALEEHLFPGTRAAVEALVAQGFLLGVATGKSNRGLRAMLAHHHLSRHFVTLQTADDHPSKPDPSMVLTAMLEAGAAPEATVMIGDTSYDMAMAIAAGASAIGVSWGYHRVDELRGAGAAAILDDYADLPATATRLIGERTA